MASSNVSSVTSHFPTANEGFTTTLSSTILSGATTVPLSSTSGLTDGSVFVGIIEPGQAKEQTFTGIVDTGGAQITGVKWTRGTNADHTAGVTIVDYVSGTGNNMITKGLLVSHDQDGTLKAGAVDDYDVLGTEAKRYTSAEYAPQGYMQNGKIVTSVASNDLTVAIKTLAGTDPSSSDPVLVRIGNTVRTITSALSVTKNDGTNWFSSGSASLATNEIDYFVYLGYNATDGVVIGFARIPYARTYGDFSTTTTNDRYCAISTITNAASSDEYENIGRFNAILSATASFNWSIPATSVIISRPIFETRLLTYSPQPTNITIGNGTTTGRYRINDRGLDVHNRFTLGTTSSITGSFPTFTLPITAATTTGTNSGKGLIVYNDNGVANYYGKIFVSSAATAYILTAEAASGAYTAEIGVSSTVPFTFGNTDSVTSEFDCEI